jgi:hypothetical protein
MINTETDSYVVLSPGGHYHDWATKCEMVNSNQYAVMRFSAYTKWYNMARWAKSNKEIALALPTPAFVGDTYAIAQSVADELNQSMKG